MMFCCVKQGDKYGDDYVKRLQAGISRNIGKHDGHTFTCYTDKPVEGVLCEPLPMALDGWWAKIGLFKLEEPLIYFDLDVVITGNLKPLMDWDGFGIIDDWWQPCFNSSVMKLTGNEGEVAEKFDSSATVAFAGDQDYITAILPDADTFPSEWFPSYKANHCEAAAPGMALAVIFHGSPKPHQCDGWVKKAWEM
jgi:hypothetical protein